MIGEVQLVAISCEFIGFTVVPPAIVKSAEDGEGSPLYFRARRLRHRDHDEGLGPVARLGMSPRSRSTEYERLPQLARCA